MSADIDDATAIHILKLAIEDAIRHINAGGYVVSVEPELIRDLRALANMAHDDFSIGDEAADALEANAALLRECEEFIVQNTDTSLLPDALLAKLKASRINTLP